MIKFKASSLNLDKNNGDFPNRIYQLSEHIHKKRLDLICFQEDFNQKNFSSGKFLNLELDYNYISTQTLRGFNLTTLSKYKIDLIDEIYFNKDKENETVCQFVCLYFKNYKFLVTNISFSKIGVSNKTKQIDEILEKIKKMPLYDLVLICGSFNALSNYPEMVKIKEDGFVSKNLEYTHEDKVIIDYIYYKSEIKKLKVESEIILKNYSSHYTLSNSFFLK